MRHSGGVHHIYVHLEHSCSLTNPCSQAWHHVSATKVEMQKSTITNEVSHVHLLLVALKLDSLTLCFLLSLLCFPNEDIAIHLLQYSQYHLALCGRCLLVPFGGATYGLALMELMCDCGWPWNFLTAAPSPASSIFLFPGFAGLMWATPGMQGPVNWRCRICLSDTRHSTSWEHLSTQQSMYCNRSGSFSTDFNSCTNPWSEESDRSKTNTWKW